MILIAIGSNLRSSLYGMPVNNCLEVIKILRKYFFVVNVSNFYKTEPIPKSDQPWYVNAAIEIKTNLKPKDIIERLFFIENHFGRIREKKNEARVIDLDLLCYGNLKINNNNLIIPHPRLHTRKFVLRPICDINPYWEHPILKKKAINLLKGLANQKIFNVKSDHGKSND